MTETIVTIRRGDRADADAVWAILEPTIRAGETYDLPRDMTRESALAYWFANEVWLAVDHDTIFGTYILRVNDQIPGGRVSNCGYMTAPAATGRGIARAMCAHSLVRAKERGFGAMQFNFVVSTNERAVRLWQAMGFAITATKSQAFGHPRLGKVDAYVMVREL
jgi:ribosomal protein S18 acetylase RimI-like enzyme